MIARPSLAAHVATMLGVSVIMCGCGTSWSSERKTNPVIQGMFYKSLNGDTYEYLSPTASRRILVVVEDSDGKTRMCAEPPPDVGEAFAEAFASGLQIAAQQGNDTTLGISGQMARQTATSITPLLYRTQGLQLYRDTMWALCNDHLSGYFKDDAAYTEAKKNVLDTAKRLISTELQIMKETQIEYFKNVKASGPTIDVNTVKELLNAAKPAQASLPSTTSTDKKSS